MILLWSRPLYVNQTLPKYRTIKKRRSWSYKIYNVSSASFLFRNGLYTNLKPIRFQNISKSWPFLYKFSTTHAIFTVEFRSEGPVRANFLESPTFSPKAFDLCSTLVTDPPNRKYNGETVYAYEKCRKITTCYKRVGRIRISDRAPCLGVRAI